MSDDAMTTQMFGSASPAPQETAGEVVDEQGKSFRWEGTEDDQFRELDKACKARCKQWGAEDCTREDHWCDECDMDMKFALRVKTHPTPAATTTDNTALVEVFKKLEVWSIDSVMPNDKIFGLLDELEAALATRPAKATSRDAVTEAARLRALLARAESFISGFEGDVSQNGVDELLRQIRAEVAP